jgi:hypothetical protein
MEIKFFCPYWGMRPMPLNEAFRKIKEAGYDGVELAIDPGTSGYELGIDMAKQYDLLFIAQHPYAKGDTPEDHLADYVYKLEKILELKPSFVNCHSGRDYYSIEENMEFLKVAKTLSEKYQVPIAHETHRGRFSFCTTATRKYIETFPWLNLTADFSHWCCVSESLLENQQDIIDKIIPHCVHIHARIGYAQGPQVPDPRAPEYQEALMAHLNWWKQIALCHFENKKEQMTITCEFGPPPYLPVMPFTGNPVTSQWDINLFMKNYLEQHL